MRGISWRLAALLLTIGTHQASAQLQRAPRPDYNHYDSRAAGSPAQSTGKAQPAALLSHFPDDVATPRIKFSLVGPLSGPETGNSEENARRFLAKALTPLGRGADSEIEFRAVRRFRSPHSRLTHLGFVPSYRGVAFFDSEALVHLDDQGRVWRFSARPVVVPEVAEVKLDAREALRVALAALGSASESALVEREPERDPEQRIAFTSNSLTSTAYLSRTWFVAAGEARPAWRIFLEPAGRGAYEMVVDAIEPRVLFSEQMIRRDRPEGLVFRAPDRATPLDGPQSLEGFTGWPASHGACPAEIYPTTFRSGSARDRCWTPGDQTTGNNADVCADVNGDNLCDGKAFGPHGRFLFPFSDSYDRQNDPGADRGAALTNAYYWVNVLHDWLYRLGFDEAAGNFQNDNYDRGGAGGDAVRVDVHDGGVPGNATFTPTPDGIPPRMQLGLFAGLRRDSSFDGDIITHEYVHGLTARRIGGPGRSSVLSLWQSGALGEGWSDAYAASLTGDAVIGEYASRNPATGIRSVAYNNSPYTFGMFGTLRPKVIPGSEGLLLQLPQVHRDGEIWATVLWDLRERLGREEFEHLVTEALALTPPRPSMLDARDAIVQIALISGAGGAGACYVWDVFAARGFGFSAALNPIQTGQASDTALSVFESFDVPTACGGSPPMPGAVLAADGAETQNGAWTASGLWHRSARRAAAGSSSWWYGRESTGNYNTGGRNRGSLTSPPIDLSDALEAVVEWNQLLRTEGFNHAMDLDGIFGPYLNADSGRLMVSSDGGSSWRVLSHIAHPTPGQGFVPYRIHLGRYAGQTIQLRFDFDTFDAQDNDFEGWYLDNIRVLRVGPEPVGLQVAPQELEFRSAQGILAAAQTLAVRTTRDGTEPLNWTASVSQGGGWLQLFPASGRTPGQVQVSVADLAIVPGSHRAEIRFYQPGFTEPVAVVAVTLTVEANDAPLAMWSFDEEGRGNGIRLEDASGKGHSAFTHGEGTAHSVGVAGYARVFDGSTAYAAVEPLDLSRPRLTLRFWIKVESWPQVLSVIGSALRPDTQQGWFVGLLGSGQVVVMDLPVSGESLWMVSRRSVELHRWHCVTVTLDRSLGRAAIYLDGENDAEGTLSSSMGGPLPWVVARASWWDGYYAHAAIDEMRMDRGVWDAQRVRTDFAGFSPPAPATPAQPVAYWRFDETGKNTGVSLSDHSGRDHPAVVTGETSAATLGVAGSAREFGGTAYARIEPHADFSSRSFSFTAWVRVGSYPQSWGVVFGNFDGADRGWLLGINDAGKLILALWGEPSATAWVLSNGALDRGRWQHVAVTFDDLTRRAAIYLDGELDRSFAAPRFTPSEGIAPTLARASWFDGYFLACALDEAKLFDQSLGGEEVKQEFAQLR